MRVFTRFMIITALAVITSIGAYAQSWDYTETFENHNATVGGYTSNSFVGDNGITWSYVRGRADNGYQVTSGNKSFMFATIDANNPRITSSTISGGIKNFRVYMKKAFTGAGNRQIALYINGNLIATSLQWDNTNVQMLEVNDIDIPGDITIEIRNLGSQVVIDDLSWTKFGGGNGGIPYKVKISSTKPAVPMKNIPFRTLIELVDNIDLNQTIPVPTRIDFKILDASANLLHQQTVYIPANSAVFFVDNLTLNYSGNIQIIAEAPENKNPAGYYLDDATAMFSVSQTPVLDLDIFDKGHVGSTHPLITLSAKDPVSGEVNEYYNNYTSTLNIANGTFTGAVNATFSKGIATFSNIVFTTPNVTYSVNAGAQYLVNSNNKSVSVLPAPTLTEIIVPRYIKGDGGFLDQGGNGRLPSFALVQFNNLHPNMEYRFTTGATTAIPNTNPTTAGNNFAYDPATNSYTMTAAKSLANPGNYTYFTTGNGQTSKVAWVNLIPTNNSIFNINSETYWAIDLGNERGSLVSRLYTTNTSRNLRLSSTANNFGTGLVSYASGLYDSESPLSPKNYVVIYDENNNPVSTGIVQTSGAVLQTPGFAHQAPSFYANFESTDGAWSVIIPNNMPGGVRRIAEFSPNGQEIKSWTDDDGVWADYNTITSNYGMFPPSENSSEIAFAIPQFSLITPNTGHEICNPLKAVQVIWNSRGVGNVNIYISQDNGSWEPLAFDVNARDGYWLWNIIRDRYSNTNNRLRITSTEFAYIDVITGTFRVFDTPIMGTHSQSNVWCPDEDIYLTVEATGTDLTYQWYKDGIALNDGPDYNGSNSPILYINNLKHRLSGAYKAVVSGHATCESVETSPIVVYVARPLSIFQPTQDVNIGVTLGGTATLEFTVHGNGGNGNQEDLEKYGFKIQWYKYDPSLPVDVPLNDGMPRIAGSKSSYLTINKFRKQDEGKYYAVVKGLCGESVKTPYFEITEIELSITQNPIDVETCINENVQFTFDYYTNINETAEIRWFKDNIALDNNAKYSGVNTKTLTVTGVEAADAGTFYAVVTLIESGSSVQTGNAFLRTLSDVTITMQSTGPLTFESGKQMLLEVIAEGNDEEQLTYQWYKDGQAITDADESIYIKDGITTDDEGIYYCQINGICADARTTDIEVIVSTGGVSTVREVSRAGYTIETVVPNPVNSSFSLNVVSPNNAVSEIVISDMTGRVIASIFDGMLTEGNNTFNVDISKLNIANGTYFVTLRNSKVALTQSFVVSK